MELNCVPREPACEGEPSLTGSASILWEPPRKMPGAFLGESHKNHPEGLLSARTTEQVATGARNKGLCVHREWPLTGHAIGKGAQAPAWGRESACQEEQPFLSCSTLPGDGGTGQCELPLFFNLKRKKENRRGQSGPKGMRAFLISRAALTLCPPPRLLPQQPCSPSHSAPPCGVCWLPGERCASLSLAQLQAPPHPRHTHTDIHSPPARQTPLSPLPRWEDTGSKTLSSLPLGPLSRGRARSHPPRVCAGASGQASKGVAPSCCLGWCSPRPNSRGLISPCQMSAFTPPPQPLTSLLEPQHTPRKH